MVELLLGFGMFMVAHWLLFDDDDPASFEDNGPTVRPSELPMPPAAGSPVGSAGPQGDWHVGSAFARGAVKTEQSRPYVQSR